MQELNTANAKNSNNTSSGFSLPSEFKEKWNNFVGEGMMDAFPDFLDRFHVLVPVVHELVNFVNNQISNRQKEIIENL